jgi:DtxR family Mn-dependent transcriptional regulator
VPSLTIENYVKTIYQLGAAQSGLPAATGQLATALGVSPGTVTSMLKTLKESGLAEYKPYEGVSLTDAGRSLALRVLRRHRLIELFLFKTLQLPWDEVHAEAENMEHAVSDHLVDRIDEYLGFPTNDPHGDPIPRADGTVPQRNTRSLAEWEVGRPFLLVRVLDQSPEFLRFLSDAELPLGTTGVVRVNRPEAGILTVERNQAETTLSHQVANKLLVAAAEIS